METIKEYICSICTQKDVPQYAVTFCPECDEALCKDCMEHHGISKVSKNHKTIPIEEYDDLPHYISSIEHVCDIHGEKLDFFCPTHDTPCCVLCLSEKHKTCKDFKPINDILKDVRYSSFLEDLEFVLTNVNDDFEKITKNKLQNIQLIKEQTKISINKIKHFREMLNYHLCYLEAQIIEKCNQYESHCISQINNLLTQIESHQKQTQQLLYDFLKTKKSATDFQVFIGTRKIRESLTENERYVQNLETNGYLRSKELRVDINPDLENLVERVKHFANINCCDMYTESLSLETLKVGPAQTLLPKHLNKVIGRTVKVKLSSDSQMDITGCKILQDGKLAFVDMRQKLLLFYQEDGKFGGSVQLPEEPYDIAFVKNDLAAVSLWDAKKVLLSNISDKSNSYITLRGKCWGLDSVPGDKMLLRFPNEYRSCIVDLSGTILQEIKTGGEYVLYNSWYSDKIYCTDWEQNKVFCYALNGTLIWCYENDILPEPLGIATDSKGFVYVAGSSSNHLVVISPDGKHGKELLTKNNGLCRPQAVHFNKSLNKLLVCNRSNGTAILYAIR